jgi:hypothetical protein
VTFLTILPMAFVMIAGPQLISAVFLATNPGWRRSSAAYVAGAALSVTLFVTAAYFVTHAAKGGGSAPATGRTGDTIDIVILVLLVILAVRVFLQRNQAEPPKWMGKLQTASPKFSFRLGLLLLGVFPTDIITSVTVGMKVAPEGAAWPLRSLHPVDTAPLGLSVAAGPPARPACKGLPAEGARLDERELLDRE